MTLGIFDSGVGGLSVLQAIRENLPALDCIYYGDTANFPYGTKTPAELRKLTLHDIGILRHAGADIIVAACNTASTSALDAARQANPDTPIVGVVPAVKPAVRATRSGVLGVCATAATLGSAAYADLKREHGTAVRIIDQPCTEWVALVEAGETTGAKAEAAVLKKLDLLLSNGADTIVLGSTHFPWLRSTIGKFIDDEVLVLDSGQAVANQVERVLDGRGGGSGATRYLCSGDPSAFAAVAGKLLGHEIVVERLHRLPGTTKAA